MLAVMVASRHVRQVHGPGILDEVVDFSQPLTESGGGESGDDGGNDEIVTYRVGGLLPVCQFASNCDPLFASNHDPSGDRD